jgi:lysophospholipase L1-like esterase
MKQFAFVLGLSLSSACGAGANPTSETSVLIDDTLKEDLATLHGARVFFGHHSVGQNILDGLNELSKEAGIEVRIDEAPVGENQHPLGKFEDFAKRGERDPSDGTQVMAMKLCYVDFTPKTDVDELVRGYVQAVERVRKARPGVKIVHVTPPLCSRPTDMKAKLNRTLGRPVWEDLANAKRLAYGKKLRETFPGEPFFDLSAVESTRPDGSTEAFDVEGKPVPMMWPGYTQDGGHLNGEGGRVAAKAFAHALASVLRK